MQRKDWKLVALLLLCYLALHWRTFLPGMTPYRGSIEQGYVYMAKTVAEDPNPWRWNPLQYCGQPLRFTYLPVLPYAEATVHWVFPFLEHTTIHRLFCAAALLLGLVSIYLLVKSLSGSTRAAAWSMAAVIFTSPLYAVVEVINRDRGLMTVPWRIQTVIKYGEGPHMVGLVFLPLALVAVWRWVNFPAERGPWYWSAPFLLALTVGTNWVAGLGLAVAVVLLLLVYGGWWRAAALGAVSYAMAAWWLTPSFIGRMAGNWPKDAFGYKLQEQERFALMACVVGVLGLWRLARWRRLPPYWTWLTLSLFTFGFFVLSFYERGVNVIPESRRYALEFELFLLLWVVETLRWGMASSRGRWQSLAFVGLVAFLLNQTPFLKHSLRHQYGPWKLEAREKTLEYQVADRLGQTAAMQRAFVTGTTRFYLNGWRNVPQVGGVFETGLRNRIPVERAYQIRTGIDSEAATEAGDTYAQLLALGVSHVVVHGPNSREFYRDIRRPEKFAELATAGKLDLLWQEADDSLYRLPTARMAHLVTREELPPQLFSRGIGKSLARYTAAMEDQSRPQLAFAWKDHSTATIAGDFLPQHEVAVAVSFEEGWQATQNGQDVPVRPNNLGFLTITPQAGAGQTLTLHYGSTMEPKLLLGLSAGMVGYWLWAAIRAARRARRRQQAGDEPSGESGHA